MDTPAPNPGPWGRNGLDAPTVAEFEFQAADTPEAKTEREKMERSFKPVDLNRLQAGIKAAGKAIGDHSHARALVIIGIGHNKDGTLCAATHTEGTFPEAFHQICTNDLPRFLGQLIMRGDIIARGLANGAGPKPPLSRPSWWARLRCRLFHRH